jgi:iron-sulfur cluster repair protein YtfE (RIC family)
MTKHLSLNTVIHAAVRRDLGRFTAALDAFPIGNKDRAAELETAWRNLDKQLYHHHHGEETIFWPALRELGADDALVSDLDGEHQRLADAMTETRTAMTSFAADPGEGQLAAVKAAFTELSAVVDTHFTHEEHDLEPMLATATETPQWKQAQRAIRRTMSLPEVGTYLAWLQDGADPDAREYLSHEFPRPVLTILPRLLGGQYNRRVASVWT